jgi:receptor protein-tyrosine kinase
MIRDDAAASEANGGRISQAPQFLRTYLRWIVVVTGVVTLTALVISILLPAKYTSHANVVVSGTSSTEPPDMGSEKEIAESGEVASNTAKYLKAPLSDALRRGLSVSVPVDTHVLIFSYTDPDPNTAQQRAQAFAEGYLRYKADRSPGPARAGGSTNGRSGPPLAEIITGATFPRSPSSPNIPLNLVVALIVGAALGVGTAFARDRLGQRVAGAGDLQARTGVPVLAVVPPFAPPLDGDAKLAKVMDNGSLSAEPYRRLRTKVRQIAERREAKLLVVTSSADHTGKTMVAANLARGLAEAGEHVILVEGDLDHPRLHAVLGMPNDVGLTSIVERRVQLEATIRPTSIRRVYLLPAGSTRGEPRVQLTRMTLMELAEQLRSYVAMIVVDAPPVLEPSDTAALIELSDLVLLVEDMQASTRAQVDAAVDELKPVRDKLIGSVLIEKQRRRTETPTDGSPPPSDAPVRTRVLPRVADVRVRELEQ